MRFTNWDKYKDNRTICKMVGCDQEDTQVCCPDLDGTLCKRKSKYLTQLRIREKDLDNNLVTVEEIVERNESFYEEGLDRYEVNNIREMINALQEIEKKHGNIGSMETNGYYSDMVVGLMVDKEDEELKLIIDVLSW